MWILAGQILTVIAFAVAIAIHRRRWNSKHRNNEKPPEPMVLSVSAFTGEVIASNQANTELGDGRAPERSLP
jgi:hypothetical protein